MATDPTDAIRQKAVTFPGVDKGTSCNQSAFKAGKVAFLYIGPGAKGQGFKAMFKLDGSMAQARKLAAKEPERFEVGNTSWVTTRFTAEKPLPRSIWDKWLKESYALSSSAAPAKKKAKKAAKKKKAPAKKGAKKKATKKKAAKKKR